MRKYYFQTIDTPLKCASLGARLGENAVIALWATTEPRPTVDVLINLYVKLCEKGYQCIFLLREDALEAVVSQYLKSSRDMFFVFEDITLLAHCSFISLLISHDYCMRGKPPQAFSGKVLLMPHNIHIPNPHAGNFWADYIVTPNTRSGSYNYSFLPNKIKIHRMPSLSMIPCGYPKLDLLIQARGEAELGPYRLAAFYPGSLWYSIGQDQAKASLAMNRWSELVEKFFAAYPDWTFVLRPYKEDRGHFLFQELYGRFGDLPNFIFDTGADNKRYLVGADIFITDYSAVEFNFPFATLCPTIVLSLDAPGPERFSIGATGYTAYSGQQVIEAIGDALEKKEFWKGKIASLRNVEIPFAGKCYEYLSEHIDDILADRVQSEWVLFDKGNTPYTTVKEWLWLFSERSGLTTQGIASQYYIWSREMLGDNKKIALAFLRYALRIMPVLAQGQDRYLLPGIESSIRSLLAYTPHNCLWRLLWHCANKNMENRFALFWLLVVTFRRDASESQVQRVVEFLHDKTISSQEMEALYTQAVDKTAIFPLLELVNGTVTSPKIFFCYSLLLINHGRPHEAGKILEEWKESLGIGEDYSPYYEMSLYIYHQYGKKKLPRFFSLKGKYTASICGVDVSFDSKRQAIALFGKEICGHLRYGERHFISLITTFFSKIIFLKQGVTHRS